MIQILSSIEEIHIENTNSCGYKCAMCPRESQTRKIGFMSLDDFSLVLERLRSIPQVDSYQGRFHLHGFGEPLLDRQLVEKIGLLKKNYPSSISLIFSTLGVKVGADYFARLLESGLSCLVISLYGFTQEDYRKIHGADGFARVKENLKFLSQASSSFPSFRGVIKVPGSSISSTLPVAEPPEKREFCDWAKGLGFEIKEWAYVHNYSSGRSYNAPNQERLCPVIEGKRRNILNITWDLHVIPCCFDFNATIRFGNLRTQTFEEIFSSSEYLSFVIAHKANDLSLYPVCQNCEKHDYS